MENTQTNTRYVCRHIHTSGNRCNSPSLRNEDFCYHHHFTRRQPPSEKYVPCDAAFDLPNLLDRPSIQLAISEIGRRLAQNQIDYDRVKLLLRTLRIASINLPKEPRNTEPVEILQVEEFEIDPIQGPIAPIAEVPPTLEARRGLLDSYMEYLRNRPCPKCTPPEPEVQSEPIEEEPIETILPEIQAVTDATKPGGPSFVAPSQRVGYRAKLDRPHSTHHKRLPLKAERVEISRRSSASLRGKPAALFNKEKSPNASASGPLEIDRERSSKETDTADSKPAHSKARDTHNIAAASAVAARLEGLPGPAGSAPAARPS
jgi:hypothetical protein